MQLHLWTHLLWALQLLRSLNAITDHESLKQRGKIAFIVIAGEPRVVGLVGSDAHFTCCISVEISTKDMEVWWYTSNMSSPVHRYHNGSDDDSQQDPRYQGRTELLHDHVRVGCVQLRLRDVRPSDEEIYTCFFEYAHMTHFARTTTTLEVAARGFDPLIHVENSQDGGIRLVCITQGWYPEPEVWWEASDGQNLTTIVSRKQSGLNVTTTIDTEDKYTCHVRSSLLNVTKTKTVSAAGPERTGRTVHTAPRPEGYCWKAILFTGIILVSFMILIFWMLQSGNLSGCWRSFLTRCLSGQTGASTHTPELKPEGGLKEKLLDVQVQGDTVEMQNLKNQIEAEKMKCRSITAPSRADFTLDHRTASPQLELSADLKQVKCRPLDLAPRPPGSDLSFRALCAMGCPAFTQGKHCWEVEVGRACSWALGVAVESVSRDGPPVPNPEDGIWAVGQPEGLYQAFTSPLTELCLDPPPEKVLVYLDMEAGQLSFYYADTRRPIYTFMCCFTEKVVAFIWTRDRDSWITVCPPPASIPAIDNGPLGASSPDI